MSRRKKVPRRTGRPSIFDEGLSMADLQKVYEAGLSCRAAAAKLGCDPKTYRKYAKAAGFDTSYTKPSPGLSVEFTGAYRTPQLLIWRRDNPHKKLPRNMEKIAEVTGIPFGTIRSYMRRRRRRMQAWLQGLGDLRTLKDTVLIDVTGRHVPCELVDSYTLTVDYYDLKVKLALMLKGSVYLKAEIPWKDYIVYFGKGPKDTPWVLPKRTLASKSPS
jgi:hypothetical protein